LEGSAADPGPVAAGTQRVDETPPIGSAGSPARVQAHRVAGFEALLAPLGIPIAAEPDPGRFLLTACDGALELRPPGESDRRGIQADFPPDREVTRGGCRQPSRPELLVRAFGARIDGILDLTAGLGADAYRLARAGHRVCAVERHPAVFALLVSGFERARRRGDVPEEVANRLRLEHGEALERILAIDAPGVGVYLDPMYPPPRRSSALPKRALQVLRQLVGDSSDAAELLAAARSRAARVVVKRPHRAPPLAPGTSHALASKLVRFDVYVNASRVRRAGDAAGTSREDV